MKKQPPKTKRPTQAATVAPKIPRPPRPPVKRPPALPKANAKTQDPLSYWRKCRWYVLSFFGALIMFAGCSWLVYEQLLEGKDYYVFRLINNWPDSVRIGFLTMTALGSFWAAAVIVVTTFVLRLYQLAWRLALSTFTVYGLLLVFKEIFGRARPEAVLADVNIRAIEASFAFPSAHTAVATMLALTLRTYLPVPAVWQWLVVAVWIGGVGLSRVYLGVHTPLDVVAGFAVGVGVVCFWRILPTSLKKILHLK